MQVLTLSISLVVLIVAVSVNAYNYMRESKYMKHKYKHKGYLKGYDQGFLDGIEFIESVIPSTPKKKKTLWDRGTK